MKKKESLIMHVTQYNISTKSSLGLTTAVNEIAIIDENENVLFNSFICPNVITPLDQNFARFYEIPKNLEKYPTFKEAYPKLKEILNGKIVYVLNKEVMECFNTCLSYLVGFDKKELDFDATPMASGMNFINLKFMYQEEKKDRDLFLENKPLAICKAINFIFRSIYEERKRAY